MANGLTILGTCLLFEAIPMAAFPFLGVLYCLMPLCYSLCKNVARADSPFWNMPRQRMAFVCLSETKMPGHQSRIPVKKKVEKGR